VDNSHSVLRGATIDQVTPRRHRWHPICEPPSDLFHPVAVDPTGATGPTRSQATRAGTAGSPWRRSSWGRYVLASVDPDVPEQRVVEAAALLPAAGAVTGWAGLRLLGARFCDGRTLSGEVLPVPLAAGPHRSHRPVDGLRWLQERISPEEVWIRCDTPVAMPERSVFDAMRLAPDLRHAVVELEMAIAAELTSLRRVAAYVAAHRGWHGVAQARAALDLACEHSRSKYETGLKLIWCLDAGLAHPLVNQEVFTLDGRLLGIADLLDVEAGVVGEYDGGDHAGALRRSRDATREGGLRDHGLEVFRVTGFDMLDPASVVRRMRAARARARWEPPEHRRWTTTPPPGWARSPSVDEVLDLRDLAKATAATG
jgi:hypothetical protein